jgi:hypothetical protein
LVIWSSVWPFDLGRVGDPANPGHPRRQTVALRRRLALRGRRCHPSLAAYLGICIIREAVNSLLSTAQLGGNLVGIRVLAHRGVPGVHAAAGTTIDVTIEAPASSPSPSSASPSSPIRELAFGLPALAAWQWAELRRMLRR